MSIADARDRARRVLPAVVFDFVDGAAEDEISMHANLTAFRSLRLRPRAATPTVPELGTTVLGQRVSFPVLLAPCGMARVVHPDAEPGVAAAADSAGTIFALTTFSGTSMEDVAACSASDRRWFQLYFVNGREGAAGLIDRARRSEYSALVVTVDGANPGRRERDLRHGLVPPFTIDSRTAYRFAPQVLARPRWLTNFARDGMPVQPTNAVPHLAPRDAGSGPPVPKGSPTWDDVAWARERWAGPLVVKGILSGTDARKAVDAGADAVVVSNHGGRQLDGVAASLVALPDVVTAVGGEVEIYLDGGVRRGTDAVKAIALGARAVFVGRPYLYGLAAGGRAGVERVLELLRIEITTAMALLGRSSVADLDATCVDIPSDWPESPHAGSMWSLL